MILVENLLSIDIACQRLMLPNADLVGVCCSKRSFSLFYLSAKLEMPKVQYAVISNKS